MPALSFMAFTVPGAEVEPVALIDKADCKQQRAEPEEAENPVPLAKLAHVGEKNLGDCYREQHQRLPAQKG